MCFTYFWTDLELVHLGLQYAVLSKHHLHIWLIQEPGPAPYFNGPFSTTLPTTKWLPGGGMPSLLRLIAVTSQSVLWESVLGVGVERDKFSSVPGCKLALVPANNACPSV